MSLKGKKIKEEKSLGGGLTMIIFTDGTFIVVSQLSDTIEVDEVFEGKTSEDDEEDEEEDDDEDEEEEDDDEEEDDEEDDEITGEDLMEYDFDDLEDIVDDYELDIDVEEFEGKEDKLRKEVAKALGVKLPKKKKK